MRLGVLSNKNLNPWINWSTLGPPLLEPLASYPDAQWIAPPPLRWKERMRWKPVMKAIYKADTLFWMQISSRPEWPLFLPGLLRGPARRSAYVIDAWKPELTKIGTFAVLQGLDPCFVAFREAYLELKERFPLGRFEWLPFGVDTAVFDTFHPGLDSDKRPIFAYWMGRRHEPLHQALVKYCAERGLTYRYPQKGEFASPAELGRLVGSSRYFIACPPNLGSPERTGGFSPFVMRYLEGLSAGARLLGVLPGSGEYDRLLPDDAILQVAPDGSDLEEKLDADRMDPKAREATVYARELVRREHSWAKRAQQIYDRLDYDKPTGFSQGFSL
jgi:Glycosyl transferases group 1